MPNTLHFNLATGASVTISVMSMTFQPQLILRKPDNSLYQEVCGALISLTADTTQASSDSDVLTADETLSVNESIAVVTFVVPVTGLWAAQIGSCDGGCGSYHFMLNCNS